MARTILPALLIAFGAGTLATPSFALSAKDCSVKYQAAKQAGTLNGQKWNDFRKAECGAAADTPAAAAANPFSPTATAPAAPAAPAPATKPTTTATRSAPSPAPAPAPKPAAAGSAVFPKAIDPKYASEAAGKQRMHTCLDQYNANKAAGGGAGNGGMNWIQKGGGYYSVCNKALKG